MPPAQESPVNAPPEGDLTLDPADWGEFRALGHRMIDDLVDHLSGLREGPVWQPMTDAVRGALVEPVPVEGQGAAAVYQQFLECVRPYPNGNTHPRFFGWVQGCGLPIAVLADLLASGMNPHLAGFNQAPALVELQVVSWLADLMGFPPGASGLLCSGGSMAGLLGLAVARHARAGFDVREEGLHAAGAPQLVIYGSSETHGWAAKAVELLGLGRKGLRLVAVDTGGRIDVAALRDAIGDDRRSGSRPICVIGTAGAVNNGATDDLQQLADVCAAEHLWFHVDGAFGAWARIVPRLRELVRGIERADSLSLDLHKWMYLPFESACLLVRDAEAHRAAFAATAPYLRGSGRGLLAGGFTFADRGVELTRSFKALKVWMALKAHGIEAFSRLIEQNVALAQRLAGRIAEHPELELLAEAPLNIVCFRYRAPSSGTGELDALNQNILYRLQESGFAVPSSTWIDGRFAIRVAIANHRTRRDDVDQLVDRIIELGRDAATCGSKPQVG